MSNKKKTKVNTKKINPIKIGIVLAVVALIYLVGSLFFRSHFYIRSTVNGVGASFKTAESTYEKIVDSADKYTISFIDAEGNVVNEVSSKDLNARKDGRC